MNSERHSAPASTCSEVQSEDSLQSARDMIARLRDVAQMRRSGTLLLEHGWLGQELSLCARLGVDGWDYARWWGESLSPERRFVAVTPEDLLQQLAQWARDEKRATTAVFNFDLPLAFLSSDERARFWNDFLLRFPKTQRAILVMLPAASTLGPGESERRLWEETARLNVVKRD